MLAERLPLAMSDSDLRVLVAAGDTPKRQRVAIASGMKSPFWPGVVDASRIIIFGVEAP